MPEKESQVLIAEIADKRPTNFILEGSEETGFPVRVDVSNARMIKSTSSVMVRKKKVKGKEVEYSDWEVRKIRYIKGCPTIWVDEQEEKKYKPNGAQDRIWIEKGTMFVSRDAMTRALYDYILHYEGNASFPKTDVLDRPENAVDVYRLLDTEAKADKIVDTFDDEVRALNFLRALKVASPEGVEYNEDAIQFLASLFALPAYPSGYKSEAFVALTNIAKVSPAEFLNTVASEKAVIEADVNDAIFHGVITIDQMRAFFTSSNKLITEFESQSQEDKIGELVDFMANPKNTLYNGQMRSEIKGKKMDLLAKK